MPNFWKRCRLRSNFYPDTRTDGAALARRIQLKHAIEGIHYKYIVDDKGFLWLLDSNDAIAKHNAMVETGASVYSAGWLILDQKGRVNLNCSSGHFMAEDPLLTENEIVAWRNAMSRTISSQGKMCGNLNESYKALRLNR